jgi:hypothetical protein
LFERGDLLFQGEVVVGGCRLGSEAQFFSALARALKTAVWVSTEDDVYRCYTKNGAQSGWARLELPESYAFAGPIILTSAASPS